jgi:hypothetical protein
VKLAKADVRYSYANAITLLTATDYIVRPFTRHNHASAPAAYVAYHYFTKSPSTAEPKADLEAIEQLTTTIEKKHIEWLEKMAETYTSSDVDLAVRVLLDYAMTVGPEKAIFEQVRCNTCGGKKNKDEVTYSVKSAQVAFIDRMVTKHELLKGQSKAVRCVAEFAMSEDSAVADIFTTQRIAAC